MGAPGVNAGPCGRVGIGRGWSGAEAGVPEGDGDAVLEPVPGAITCVGTFCILGGCGI
jgi:hypothetical protein